MAEKKPDGFSFDIDSTNELSEEIYSFADTNSKRKNIIFVSVVLLISILIISIFYQLGLRLNIDREKMSQIYYDSQKTDAEYIKEKATKDTLLAENEALTQKLLQIEEKSKQIKDYSINKSNLARKVEEAKAQHDALINSIENKKRQLQANPQNIYTLTLTPGIYSAQKNIPVAKYLVTGNGSILISSTEGENLTNEKLSKDNPLEISVPENSLIKLTAITTFTLKE